MPSIRFRFTGLLLAFLFLTALASPARSLAAPAPWTPLGPYGGTVRQVIVHPTNPRILYLDDDGIFRSTDAGASWQAVSGVPGPSLLAIDPARPSILQALTTGYPVRLFKSTDGGSHWAVISQDLPGDLIVWNLAVDANRARIYLGTLEGLWKSDDGGVHWRQANDGFLPEGRAWITALATPGQAAGIAYAGLKQGGIYRTDNGGATWTLLSHGLPVDMEVEALAVSPSDSRTVYARLKEAGIYRSQDGGASWSAGGDPFPEEVPVKALTVHPRAPRTVYAGSDAGLSRSTDGGAHWSAVGLPSRIRVRAVALDSTPKPAVYVGAAAPDPASTSIDPGGVLRGANGGASWTRINHGLTGLTALSTAVDPGDPDILVASLWGTGLFRSTDRGAHWVRTSAGLPVQRLGGVSFTKVLAPRPGVFYALEGSESGRLWKSTDGGLTWSVLPGPGGNVLLRADPFEPDTLYALLGLEVKRSVDGGATWSVLLPAAPPLGVCFIKDFTVARASASKPAVFSVSGRGEGTGTSFQCQVSGIQKLMVFRGTEGSWTEVDSGLPRQLGTEVSAIAADSRHPSVVYAGMGFGYGGVAIWKSADAGASWQPSGPPGLNLVTLALSPFSGDLWAAATFPGRVFRSRNAGAVWREVPGGLDLTEIAFDPSGPHRVYGSGRGGVWAFHE